LVNWQLHFGAILVGAIQMGAIPMRLDRTPERPARETIHE